MKTLLKTLIFNLVCLSAIAQEASLYSNMNKNWPDCPIPSDNLLFIVDNTNVVQVHIKKDIYDQSFHYNLVDINDTENDPTDINSNQFIINKTATYFDNLEKVKIRRFCTNRQYGSRFIELDIPEPDYLKNSSASFYISGNCYFFKFTSGEPVSGGIYSLVYFDEISSSLTTVINETSPYFTVPKSSIDTTKTLYLTHGSQNKVLIKATQETFSIIGTPLENSECSSILSMLACGAEVNVPTTGVEDSTFSPAPNQVLKIKGFPFQIGTGSSGNASSGFSGSGKISLPMDNSKFYSIAFSNIKVDNNFNVIDGNVTISQASPTMDFSSAGYAFQGEICKTQPPLPSDYDSDGFDINGLNARGFDSTGINNITMDSFDVRGFDVNGMHKGGGTYDESGCNVNMKDANGNECKPTQDKTQLMAFTDALKKSGRLNNLTDSIFQLKINSIKADSTNLNCGNIRAEVVQKIMALGYDDNYIVGVNNEYLNPGMSKNFISEPKPLVTAYSNRNANTAQLELKHIELFKCDVKEVKFAKILSFLTPEKLAEYKKFIDQKMLSLSKAQVENFKSKESDYVKWLSSMLNLFISENGITIAFNEKSKADKFEDFNPYTLLAQSNGDIYTSDKAKDIQFMFEQGYDKINGVDRGLFVEELYNQMLSNGAMEEELGQLPLMKVSDPAVTKGTTFKTYFDNIVITPNSASVDVYLIYEENRLTDKNNNSQKIVFSAKGVSFGPGGFEDTLSICLESKIEIPASNGLMISMLPGTCVKVDCDGFVGMQLNAGFTVCRDMIVPHGADLKPLPEDSLFTLIFSASISSWNDMYFEFSGNKPFSVAGLSSVVWKLDNLVLDLSQSRSPENIGGLPVEYANVSPHFQANGNSGVLASTWEGLYIKNLVANLPGQFMQGDSVKTIAVRSVLVDDQGFTGQITGSNLIPFEEGNLGGWQFSLQDFNLLIIQNNLSGGGFGGEIRVPVLETPLAYTAKMYSNDNYEFNIQPLGTNRMDFLSGEVELLNNSLVKVIYKDGEFLAKAVLNGSISIVREGSNLNLPNITFSNFEVFNKAPYFNPGNWGTSDSHSYSIGGYGMNLRKLGLVRGETVEEAGLSLGIDLILSDLKITAGGDFQILGNLDESSGTQRWSFKKIKFFGFKVDATFGGGNKIRAELFKFENDQIYGNGFMGKGSLTLPSFGEVGAFAVFGKNDEYKYFAIEALANLNSGIQAGPITINGFGGGLSYKMNMVFQTQVEPTENTSVNNYNLTENSMPSQILATSLTGVQFTPDGTKGLGLQAFAFLSLAKNESAFNGVVRISALFNSESSGGGLDNITLSGVGAFMSQSRLGLADLNNNAERNESTEPNLSNISVSAYIKLELGFKPANQGGNYFTGDIYAYMNAANGRIKGSGDGNKLVDGKIVINSSEWYIYMGTPDSRCGISLNLGVATVNANAYFDIGSNVPSMPPLPQNVKSIANKIRDNNSIRDLGSGFVFGAGFDIKATLDAGIATAEANVGAGFDIMLRQFENAHCVGSTEEIGINGWYGMGQLWAYIQAKLEVLGVDVLDAGLAAVLQAQFPNPSAARGTLAISVGTLFGKWNGSVSVKLGDDCVIAQGGDNNPQSALGMEIINTILPGDQMGPVALDEIPTVEFNLPLDKNFTLPDLTNTNVDYIAKLDNVLLTSNRNGNIPNLITYKSGNTGIEIKPSSLFYSNDTITLTIKVKVIKNGNAADPIYEEKFITFYTGKALENVPLSNIAYAYPAIGMANFYKSEYVHAQGFIQLAQAQPELFFNLEEDEEVVALVKSGSQVNITKVVYDAYSSRLVYDLNPAWLENESFSSIEVVLKKPNSDSNKQNGDENELSEVSESETENPFAGFEIQSLVKINFRVSKYNDFASKVNTVISEGRIIGEQFDQYELSKNSQGKSIITVEILESSLSPCLKTVINKLTDANNNIATICERFMYTRDTFKFDKYVGLTSGVNFIPTDIGEIKSESFSTSFSGNKEIKIDFDKDVANYVNNVRNRIYSIYTNSNINSQEIDNSIRQQCYDNMDIKLQNYTQSEGCNLSTSNPPISPQSIRYLARLTNNNFISSIGANVSYALPDGQVIRVLQKQFRN
jgi:hypothetical protein